MSLLPSAQRVGVILLFLSFLHCHPAIAQQPSQAAGMKHTDLNKHQRTALIVVTSFAWTSMVAVLTLAIFILYNLFRQYKLRTGNGEMTLTPFAIYFLNLMFFDAIQALGSIWHIRWILKSSIVEGTYCTVQGMTKQFGDVGVSLTTLSISLSTFFLIVFELAVSTGFSFRATGIVLGFIWTFILLIISIPFARFDEGHGYYGINGLWCWITPNHLKEGIGLEYAWFWITAGLNVCVYVPVFFSLRGNLCGSMSKKGVWLAFRRRGRSAYRFGYEKEGDVKKWHWGTLFVEYKESSKAMVQRGRVMLWYPAAYIVTILPLSIVRFMKFTNPNRNIPVEWTAFSSGVFACSGLFNVLLFIFTGRRYGLLPENEPPNLTPTPARWDGTSFYGDVDLFSWRPADLPMSDLSPQSPAKTVLYPITSIRSTTPLSPQP